MFYLSQLADQPSMTTLRMILANPGRVTDRDRALRKRCQGMITLRTLAIPGTGRMTMLIKALTNQGRG